MIQIVVFVAIVLDHITRLRAARIDRTSMEFLELSYRNSRRIDETIVGVWALEAQGAAFKVVLRSIQR